MLVIDWIGTDWADKKEYLEYLADSFEVDYETVEALADLLGDIELFDGLLNALEEVAE